MTVKLTEKVTKELTKLDKQVTRAIIAYLKKIEKLEDPRSRGKELTGPLAGLWRYRVADYRLICHINDADSIILVLNIGHRKNIYE